MGSSCVVVRFNADFKLLFDPPNLYPVKAPSNKTISQATVRLRRHNAGFWLWLSKLRSVTEGFVSVGHVVGVLSAYISVSKALTVKDQIRIT